VYESPAAHEPLVAVTPASSMATHAAALVRAMIVSGELAPGARIVENRLAPLLGVSRPPLREGLRLLEREGLVVQELHRGVTVVELGQQDVYEIVTLRRALEEMAVNVGVPVRDPERLAALETALEVMEAHALQNDEASASDDSYAFHLALIALAGNSRLVAAYRSLSLQLTMAMNRRSRAGEETLTERAARHRLVVDAVRRGDPADVLAELHDEVSLDFARRMRPDKNLSVEASEWFAAQASTR